MNYWKPYKSNQILLTHRPDKCQGTHCAVHNPSEHHMRDWPQHYRWDAGITERICQHGIGHPDPDDVGAKGYVHGCDGCCTPPEEDSDYEPSILSKLLARIRMKFNGSDETIEVMGELESANLEIEELQAWIHLAKRAMVLHEEVRNLQKQEINQLKVYSGLAKKRGRKKKA